MAQARIELPVVRRIRTLSRMAAADDEHTWNHTLRINLFSRVLAGRLGLGGAFSEEIGLMAQVHDLGKVRIARQILVKPGRLTAEEWGEIRKHPQLGAEMVGPDRALRMARSIALSHHERWDGTGYPFGLKGRRIPVSGRIVAVADVYDALRSPRPYKPPLDHETSLEMILRGSDRTRPDHFDPDVLAALRECHGDLDTIYRKSMDRRRRPRLAA